MICMKYVFIHIQSIFITKKSYFLGTCCIHNNYKTLWPNLQVFHHGVYLEFWHFNNHSLLNWSQPIVGLYICLFKIQNLFYMYFCNCNSVEFNKNIDTDASVKICCDWLEVDILTFNANETMFTSYLFKVKLRL